MPVEIFTGAISKKYIHIVFEAGFLYLKGHNQTERPRDNVFSKMLLISFTFCSNFVQFGRTQLFGTECQTTLTVDK